MGRRESAGRMQLRKLLISFCFYLTINSISVSNSSIRLSFFLFRCSGDLGAWRMGAGRLGAGHLISGHLVAGHLSAGRLGAGHLGADHLSAAHLAVARHLALRDLRSLRGF